MFSRFLSSFFVLFILAAALPAGAVSSYAVTTAPTSEPAVANGFGASWSGNTAAITNHTATAPQTKLTRAERKDFRKSIRQALRANDGSSNAAVSTIALIIIAIFIPPLAMLLYDGGLTKRFWISLLLTLLFFLPGLIYTIYIIASGK